MTSDLIMHPLGALLSDNRFFQENDEKARIDSTGGS